MNSDQTRVAPVKHPTEEPDFPRYCSVPLSPPPQLDPEMPAGRASAILTMHDKWANGTVLHYYFFDRQTDGEFVFLNDGTKEWRTWVGAEDQLDVVRAGFKAWKEVGIGLEFEEVDSRDDAEIRIGFMQGDGSWSYVGTQVLQQGAAKRTMNFGWKLAGSGGLDTAIHEIGHTLGFNHEHQNPIAGIVWNEEAVYTALAGPPNRWPKEKTYHNILRKLQPDTVQGSSWDPDSVMHYPFDAGLIISPKPYDQGIRPRGGLSDRDRAWVTNFYPVLDKKSYGELVPGRSEQLVIGQGEQQNFYLRPKATRKYNIRTFGTCDSLLALFADENGKPRYMTADDDSGEDRNASLQLKLVKGGTYILRVQLRYADASEPPTVMLW